MCIRDRNRIRRGLSDIHWPLLKFPGHYAPFPIIEHVHQQYSGNTKVRVTFKEFCLFYRFTGMFSHISIASKSCSVGPEALLEMTSSIRRIITAVSDAL